MKKLKNFWTNKEKYTLQELVCNRIILITLGVCALLWIVTLTLSYTKVKGVLEWVALITFITTTVFIYVGGWKMFLVWRRKRRKKRQKKGKE